MAPDIWYRMVPTRDGWFKLIPDPEPKIWIALPSRRFFLRQAVYRLYSVAQYVAAR